MMAGLSYSRWRLGAAWVLLIFGFLGTGCGSSQHGSSGDPCADVELDVERVWSADIRAEFLGKGGSVGGQTREVIATRLDDLSRDWVMERRSVCLDRYQRNAISQDAYVARTSCLDDRLAHQRTLVSTLTAGKEGVDASAELAALSQETEQCRAR
jgi:hypothetical protein